MLQVANPNADLFDLIVEVEPWTLPYRAPLRGLLAARAGHAPPDGAAWNGPAIEGIEASRRAATLARWNAGANVWRRWSEAVKILRRRLQRDAGAERLLSWLAYADFSDHSFAEAVDFGTLKFPAGASFARTTFAGEAWFSDVQFHGRADFNGSGFLYAASFENSRFAGEADFGDVVFLQAARFTSFSALCGMTFRKAEFCNDAWFRYSQFSGSLDVSKARIGGEAGFGNCLYAQNADFSDVAFRDNAGFDQCKFEGDASFARATFSRHARFEKSSFREKPSFTGARFLGNCHFDDPSVPIIESTVAEQLKAIERGLRKT